MARAGSVRGAGRRLDALTPETRGDWSGLESIAAADGHAWAVRSCEDLRREGRSIAGGWPGTLSQARARLRACMTTARADRGVSLTREDLDWLSRTLYLNAKAEWLAQVEPGCEE